ncbi:MAG TPA: hypothetical protein VFR15_11930 [Chloroflexia bacterium]|nr:hypothetical protein [Chloroflexia bacterium]
MIRRPAARLLLLTLFFTAWAVLFTYPLALHLGDSVVRAGGADVWLHLWDLWWADKALVDLGQNPYYTNYLYYPTGLNLFYHSLNILNGVASIPLQHLFGLTPAFNLLVLANLVLDGLCAYWLCTEVTGSSAGALVGGMLFASAPLLGTSLNLGQLDEVTVWWIPLFVMALLRALHSPGAPWQRGGGRRATLAAGLLLAGASLATWYFTAGLVVFSLLFVPSYLLATRSRPDTKAWLHAGLKGGAAVAVFAVLLSPLIAAMIGERLSGATYMLPSYETTFHNSADLSALMLPGRSEIASWNEHGSNVALGWVALALSGVALVSRWRKTWPWLVALAGLVVMSLGPELQAFGADLGLPMPYALLANVPFIGASRQPLRFLATAGVSLSVLAAFGTAFLAARLGRPSLRPGLVLALMTLIVAELFGLPRALATTRLGPAFDYLQALQPVEGVMELPYEFVQPRAGFNATYHEKPILGGYTSRHFPYPFIEGAPGAAQLAVGYPETLAMPDIISPAIEQTALASLDHYRVRYVAVDKAGLATGRFGRLVSLLEELYPNGPEYEDEQMLVYITPRGPGQEGSLPLVGLGKGWHEVEDDPVRRWAGSDPGNGNAQVWVGIRPQAVGRYRLSLDAFSYGRTRRLSVVLNGNVVSESDLGLAPQTIETDLGDLAAGDYVLELRVDGQPENPPGDRRTLSFGSTRLIIERIAP